MATSSIFQNIILTNKKEIEKFAEALDKSEKHSEPIKKTDSHNVTGSEAKSLVERMIKANA